MNFKDLLPWKKKSDAEESKEVEIRRKYSDPFTALHEHMNGVFKDFFQDFGSLDFPRDRMFQFSPSIDVRETDDEILVSAELPGMTEEDIDVSLSTNSLTIKGEKKSESKSEEKGYRRIERSYGSFQRTVALPCEVHEEKAKAVCKNGVLTVTLPKTEKARSSKRKIEIKTA